MDTAIYLIFAGTVLFLFGRFVVAADLVHLIRPSRRVEAKVVRYLEHYVGFTAVFAFEDETGEHEVNKPFGNVVPQPAIGSVVILNYPVGRPDLARPREPIKRVFSYIVGLTIAATALAAAFGWIDRA